MVRRRSAQVASAQEEAERQREIAASAIHEAPFECRLQTPQGAAEFQAFNISAAQLGQDGGVIVGRNPPQGGVLIADGAISRQHLNMSVIGEELFVVDLDSENGTFVNGQSVVGRSPQRVADGDLLKVGPIEFEVTIRPV